MRRGSYFQSLILIGLKGRCGAGSKISESEETVGDPESEWMTITSGVPLDSVFGLILFVIHINNLPKNVNTQVHKGGPLGPIIPFFAPPF